MSRPITIVHNIRLFPQPTNRTCWSAATTMILGTSELTGPGSATATARGLESDFTNIAAFARSHGLTMYSPQSWSVDALISLIKRGPVVMTGNRPTMHAVVIAGIRSEDGTPERTFLTIYDPWPVSLGRIDRRVRYSLMMRKFPTTTTYMLQKPRGQSFRSYRATR